jgi:carboxylate-amine ligase
VEVRAADVGLDVGDAVLQGALTRGLVRAALRDLTAGVEAPPIDPQVGAAALWSAARYGLSGPGVDPVRGVPLPATDLVDALLVRISPDLDETCDRAATIDLLESVVRRGGGAGRQRVAGLSAVVAEFALRP